MTSESVSWNEQRARAKLRLHYNIIDRENQVISFKIEHELFKEHFLINT